MTTQPALFATTAASTFDARQAIVSAKGGVGRGGAGVSVQVQSRASGMSSKCSVMCWWWRSSMAAHSSNLGCWDWWCAV